MTFRLGFIGGAEGSIIGTSHYAAARLDNRWQLMAGCFSRNAERNRLTALARGVDPERCDTDWQVFLAKEAAALDAVAILTPSEQHAEIAAAAMRIGLPVICEKPLFTDSDQIATLEATQSETQGFLAMTYNYAAYAMIGELRQRIRRGDFGQLWHLHLEMPQSWLAAPQNLDDNPHLAWRLQGDAELPAVLSDLGSHLLHLAAYVSDQWPEAVFADLSSHNPTRPGYPDDAKVLLRYASGLRGSLWISTTATGNPHGMSLRVHGETAGAQWLQEHPNQLTLRHLDGRQEILEPGGPTLHDSTDALARMTPGHPAGFIDGFGNLYHEFADQLQAWRQGERPNGVCRSAAQNAQLHHCLVAMVASARQQSWRPTTNSPQSK